jgi:UDP-N-acetylmuramoylalanine--D-glutamate ligase
MPSTTHNLSGRKIAVLGAARSGVAAARVLTTLGARVVVADDKSPDALGEARLAEIAQAGAQFVNSTLDDTVATADLVVTSPGVPKSAQVLQRAVSNGTPVWSEIELAYRIATAPIIAITGTNGKTTTTVLTAAILQTEGRNAIVCGNVSADEIKRTLVEAAFETRDQANAVLVAEISSFQLEWVEQFAPRVAVLTNITPDHLNRHASFEEYAETKGRIFAAQSASDWAVVNWEDPVARRVSEGARAQRIWFSSLSVPPAEMAGAWLESGDLVIRRAPGGPVERIIADGDLPESLPGRHSRENALAAAAAAMALGATAQEAAQAIKTFRGVAHRMEFVAEIGGVRYINNSMCTNIAAAVRSLESLNRPAIVIAGGEDKGLDFEPLAPVLETVAKETILIGRAADKMERTFRGAGYDRIRRAETLEEAVRAASEKANPGDTVILSPACASFGMFTDFEARGAAFRRAVHTLEEYTP